MAYEPKRGVKHIDRLMHVLLEIAENPSEDPINRLAAAKEAATLVKVRKPPKHDKKKLAIQKMMGNTKPQDKPASSTT